MFKAVLLGQWHKLSDPELEHSLVTRLDFLLFCGFDEMGIPDHSTLCRYRNWPGQDDTLATLLNLINAQLAAQGLKIKKAQAAVIDATLIQSAGAVRKKALKIDAQGEISVSAASKDEEARWAKKGNKYTLGYKQHTRTDEEGYIEKLYITPANAHESKHLAPLLAGVKAHTTVYADKGYESKANQAQLQKRKLIDGIMRRAQRNTA